jgi:hypothetical protein
MVVALYFCKLKQATQCPYALSTFSQTQQARIRLVDDNPVLHVLTAQREGRYKETDRECEIFTVLA